MQTSEQPREYPEHQKLKAIKDKSQTIGEFLEWLREKGISLAKPHEHTGMCLDEDGDVNCGHFKDQLYSVHKPITEWLAEYFGIDQKKIDAEKEAMLEELRRANDAAQPGVSGAGKVTGAKSNGGRFSRSAKRSSQSRAHRG